jgi:tetratricopeptide (TPR) repeat protein
MMLSALLPKSLLGWRERRRALRELGELEQQEEWTLERDDNNSVNRAKASLAAGDREKALYYWNEAKTRYPRVAKRLAASVDVVLGLRLYDEAEELALEGQRREPKNQLYAGVYALAAERRGETEEAIRRWEHVRKQFPGYSMGYVNGGMCLRAVGQLDAAEEMLATATRLFPHDGRAWIDWANLAEFRGDWVESARRWQVVIDRTRHVAGEIGIARAMEKLGRMDEAEERLRNAQFRFPLFDEVLIARLRLAHARGDKDAVAERCAETIRRFPLLPLGYREGARYLVEMGSYDEAANILQAAIDRFPKEAWPAVECASLAHMRKDWAPAAALWAAVRAGWPDRQDGYFRGAEALAALGQPDEAAQLRAAYRARSAR